MIREEQIIELSKWLTKIGDLIITMEDNDIALVVNDAEHRLTTEELNAHLEAMT